MDYSRIFILTGLLAAVEFPAGAQVLISQNFNNIHEDIPDGDPSGLADSRTISTPAQGPILDVNVTLTLSGTGFGAVNGDIYAYLSHGSGLAVLLNRVGRSGSSSLGYDDSGFTSVTFDDAAPHGDVHTYRLTLSSDSNTPLSPYPSALTETWAPDGRNVSPLSLGSVLDGTARTALLSSFNGLNPNGEWTLFLADVARGGTARLEGWGLEITAVPEPKDCALAFSLVLLACGYIYSRRRGQHPSA
jgi:subtilisin-like proprotein convertase family protein